MKTIAVKRKLVALVILEILLYNQFAFAYDPIKGFVPFEPVISEGRINAGGIDYITQPFLLTFPYVPAPAQGPSYTIGGTFVLPSVEQPYSMIEFAKIIEPSFIPDLSFLNSLGNNPDVWKDVFNYDGGQYLNMINTARRLFTMDKDYIPIFLFEDSRRVKNVSEWKSMVSRDEAYLPHEFFGGIVDYDGFSAGWERTIEMDNGMVLQQRKTLFQKDKKKWDIYGFTDLGNGEEFFLIIEQNNFESSITSYIAARTPGNGLTPIYEFCRKNFQLNKRTSGYVNSYDTEIFIRPRGGGRQNIGLKVTVEGNVNKRRTDGSISEFDYRLLTEGSISIDGNKIPINSVVEYRDVCLDERFSVPFSYRQSGYSEGNMGLDFATYFKRISLSEELFVDFKIDGIVASDQSQKSITYVRHFSDWDLILDISNVDLDMKTIYSLSRQDLHDIFNSSAKTNLNLRSSSGDKAYSLSWYGTSSSISMTGQSTKMIDLGYKATLSNYTISVAQRASLSLGNLFNEDFMIDSFIANLEKNVPNFSTNTHTEVISQTFKSGNKVISIKTAYLIDFKNGLTTVQTTTTEIEANDEAEYLNNLLSGNGVVKRILLKKYSQLPTKVANGTYQYNQLSSNNVVLYANYVDNDGIIDGVLLDYNKQTAEILSSKGEGNIGFRQYSRLPLKSILGDSLYELKQLKQFIESSPAGMEKAGIYKYDQDNYAFQKLWEITKGEDGSYTYSVLPVLNFQEETPYLYNLLKYTGQLEKFLNGEEVTIDLVKELNDRAKEIGAGRDKANGFIHSLIEFWGNYRRVLFNEMSLLGASVVNGYNGSDSRDFVLKIKLGDVSTLSSLREKKRITVMPLFEEVSGITIIEQGTEMGSVLKRIVLKSSMPPQPKDYFDFLYNYYLTHTVERERWQEGYVINNGIEEVYDSQNRLRIRLRIQDGRVVDIEYPNPNIESSPVLKFINGDIVQPGWNSIYALLGKEYIMGALRHLDEEIGKFTGKYRGVEGLKLAEEEGVISDYIVPLFGPAGKIMKISPETLLIILGNAIIINRIGKMIAFELVEEDGKYRVNITLRDSNRIIEAKSGLLPPAMLDPEAWGPSVYRFMGCTRGFVDMLSKGSDVYLSNIKDMLVFLQSFVTEGGPGGDNPFSSCNMLEYPNDDYFRFQEYGLNESTMALGISEQFFNKISEFNYYCNISKVADQIKDKRNEWITLPSAGSLSDILGSYSLEGFRILNDCISGLVLGGKGTGSAAFRVGASKIYMVDSAIAYDENGIGDLTYINPYTTEFEFGDDKPHPPDMYRPANKDGFIQWVNSILSKELQREDEVTRSRIFDALWEVYQFAKREHNMGIFYYYLRGAGNSGYESGTEMSRLMVAADAEGQEGPLHDVATIMTIRDGRHTSKPNIAKYFGIWRDYFKYLVFPEMGDSWEPASGQLVLKSNEIKVSWDLIGAVAATVAVYILDRTGVLDHTILPWISAKLASAGLGGVAKVIGWGVKAGVGGIRGSSIFTFFWGLPLMFGQSGSVNFTTWFNSLGAQFWTGFMYSVLFGLFFTPAQLGIGDMAPLISWVGRPFSWALERIGGSISPYSSALGSMFNFGAKSIRALLSYGNALQGLIQGPRGASLTNWRYILYYHPTELMEETLIPAAIKTMFRDGSQNLLFASSPMVRTIRNLAIANLINTETFGGMAEMLDFFENPLGLVLLPGIMKIFRNYGWSGVVGLRVPTD
ncbi:MAG: hypothetical protein NC818_00185 [Candidatus Omnitrophica bacterium]|nr:hypothetical protein [Candidatus Omnitrophota bacterium]